MDGGAAENRTQTRLIANQRPPAHADNPKYVRAIRFAVDCIVKSIPRRFPHINDEKSDRMWWVVRDSNPASSG